MEYTSLRPAAPTTPTSRPWGLAPRDALTLLFPGARSQRASDLNACPWRLRTRWWVWPRPPRGRPSLLSQVGGRGRLSLPELQLPFRGRWKPGDALSAQQHP